MCVWIRRISLLYWSVFFWHVFQVQSLIWWLFCCFCCLYIFIHVRIFILCCQDSILSVIQSRCESGPNTFVVSKQPFRLHYPASALTDLCCSDHCTAWHCFKHCCSTRMLTLLVNVSQFLAFYQHSEFIWAQLQTIIQINNTISLCHIWILGQRSDFRHFFLLN